MKALVLLAGLLLAGCQTTGSAVSVVCPQVRHWTAEFQRKAAAELRKLPSGSAVAQIVIDSIGDRDRARACMRNRSK